MKEQQICRRRYLTDPDEIRAYRKRHMRIATEMLKSDLRKYGARALTFYHRAVLELTIASAFFAAGFFAFGAVLWVFCVMFNVGALH